MKLRKARIENFKRLRRFDFDFMSPGGADQLRLILGDNGAGKSSLLQALALPLSMAMDIVRDVPSFDWVGFVPGRFQRGGQPFVHLELEFDDDEIAATREVAELWDRTRPEQLRDSRPFIKPGNTKVVTLELRGEELSAGTASQLFQFKGRAYARRLSLTGVQVHSMFYRLPGLFWFDQYRNLGSLRHEDTEGVGGRQAFEGSVEKMRDSLLDWYFRRQFGKGAAPYNIETLEERFSQVFPGRSFVGPEAIDETSLVETKGFYFLLEDDGGRQYDIEEMSAGEQAVLPILYEFIRQRVGKSLVLVDELDLNLHPPAAQLFASQLLRIAPDCQFVATTHSEAVTSVFSPDEIVRLKGGRLCL